MDFREGWEVMGRLRERETQILPGEENVSLHEKEALTVVGQLWLLLGQKEAAAHRGGEDLVVDLRE